jgi:hypothetical protein
MNLKMNQIVGITTPSAKPGFTATQGQYLAFIYAYTRVLGRPPAEADMQRHFKVTAPVVHQMILTLERKELLKRKPTVARSIQTPGRSASAANFTLSALPKEPNRQILCAAVLDCRHYNKVGTIEPDNSALSHLR